MDDAKKPPVSAKGTQSSSFRDTWDDISSVVQVLAPIGVTSPRRPKISSVPPRRILPSYPPKAPDSAPIKGVRLFVIDEDPIRVDALAMDLRNLGATVAVGDRSPSGYAQAAKFLPDAIISDLVRPGEPGFQFIQSLRRHPLLRWASVVLIRWWKEIGDGEGQVLLDPVLDQLEEVLGPIQIIEERISAGRPIGERLEMTGPAALLKLIAKAKLTGELSVNDAWNMYTIQMFRGRILLAYRKGIDGESDDNHQAIRQLLLCDTGRWSFRLEEIATKREALGTEEAIKQANKVLSELFGPRQKQRDDIGRHLFVRHGFLRTASEILSESMMMVPEAISRGADYRYFAATIKTRKMAADVERVLQTLFRAGAIRYVSEKEAQSDANEPDSATSIAELLKLLGEIPFLNEPLSAGPENGHNSESGTRTPEGPEDKPGARKGAYHLQDVRAEQLKGEENRSKPMRLMARDDSPGANRQEPPSEAAFEDPKSTEVVTRGRRSLGQPPVPTRSDPAVEHSGTEKMLMESRQLALGGLPAGVSVPRKETSHMWVAILLALVLGGLLFYGVYMIASMGKEARSTDAAARERTEV
jgi:hypothetical protein